MIESGHQIYSTVAYPALALGLLCAIAAIYGAASGNRRLVISCQTVVGAHLIMFCLLANEWWMAIPGIAIAAGGFFFGGQQGWRYAVWALLTLPVGAIYMVMMGISALYVIAKGPYKEPRIRCRFRHSISRARISLTLEVC